MIQSMQQFALLAQRDRWERLGDRFGGRVTYQWSDIVIWGGFLAVLGIAIFWFSRHTNSKDAPRVSRSPKGLFRELCRAHGLNRASQKLLKTIAAGYGLAHPATLFLDPDRFALERLPKSLAASKDQIVALREQLFATNDDKGKAERSGPN